MINDKTSTYSSLLDKCNYTTLHIRHIKALASEVFKSLNNLNIKPNIIKKEDVSCERYYCDKYMGGSKVLMWYV